MKVMKRLKAFIAKYWPKGSYQLNLNHGILLILALAGFGLAGYAVFAHYTEVLPDSAIHFLNDAVLPKSGQKVLIFSPHPDDETIAAGGYIYDALKNGAEVKIILVTDGNKHGLKERRYAEFRKATADLGVSASDLIFLNYPDGNLKGADQNAVLKNFNNSYENYKPDIIIYPSPADTHPDHAQTGKLTEQMMKTENFGGISYEYLVHHAHFPQPKAYRPDNYLLPPVSFVTFDKEWQRYMLSSATEKVEIQAIDEYKSQLKTPILRSEILASIRKNELFMTGDN